MNKHKSVRKSIAVNKRRHASNLRKIQYYKACLKQFKKTEDKATSLKMLNQIVSLSDKLVSKHIYQKNKAARLKSKCYKIYNRLSA